MTIRIARPGRDEAAALASLHIRCWREAYGDLVPAQVLVNVDLEQRTAIWARALDDQDRIVLAAYDGEAPVGFIMAGPPTEHLFDGMDGHVSALYVAASHYRLGLGRMLLSAAAAQWLARGGKSLALGVMAANARARGFYDAAGGRVVSTGTYTWEGHSIPDAIYLFDDLETLADIGRLK